MSNRRQFLLAIAVGVHALPLRAQTPARLTHRVRITKFTFEPALIEVRAGDVIEWTNQDLVPHTATANDHSWDTGSLENGVTSRIVMRAPGMFAYRCAFHPHMEGVVTVVR
jgi:plastocyanin